LNADPTQQYFVDGIADDLITELAVIPHLTVIARDSSFNYREKHRNLKEIASALNVRYLIDGTVSKANDRVRINAHLDDTTTGTQIWANGFEGSTKDIFNLRHRITKSVISALAVKLTPAEEQYVSRPDTTNLDAYKQYLHGTQRFFLYAKASNVEARDFFTKAIDLDPKMARAHAMLGWTNAFDFMNGWSNKPDQSLDDAEQQATQALALDKNLPVAYFVRGLVYRERGEYAKGLVEAEHAIALDPNYANGHVLYATLLYYAGRPQDGLEQMKQAIQLNPHYPFNYPFHLGQAYFVLKRYDEAIAAFKSGLGSDPSEERLHVWLAAAYAQSGRLKDAKWEADEVLVANPDFSLKKLKRAFPFANRADLANFVEGARKAGLPE
jgi:adenylate cyclase